MVFVTIFFVIVLFVQIAGPSLIGDLITDDKKKKKTISLITVVIIAIFYICDPTLSNLQSVAMKIHNFIWTNDAGDEEIVGKAIAHVDNISNSDSSEYETPDHINESAKPSEEDNYNKPNENYSTDYDYNTLTPEDNNDGNSFETHLDVVTPSPNDTSITTFQDLEGAVADSESMNSSNRETSLPQDVETILDSSTSQDTVFPQDTYIQPTQDYSTIFPSYTWGGELISVTYTVIEDNTEQEVISSTTTISGGELLYEYSEVISDEVVYPEF